jgi:glutamyl-tRNA synthetase
VGNARTYLLAWLSVRSRGGRVVLRMEDIDSPRIKPGAAQQAIDDLTWLGLDWDEGYGHPESGPHAPYIQSQRLEQYEAALQQIQRAERAYPCTCTRSDVAAAASAPHLGQEGPVYPGTCRSRTAAEARSLTTPYSWRFRTTDRPRQLFDRVAGECAYQLAVVVDDHAMGVTEVVRGDDLLSSAFRQVELYEFFGWEPPEFTHVPLVIGPDGRRLAKRHGDTRLSLLRQHGVPPERLIGVLAWSCGLRPTTEPVPPRELIADFDLGVLPRRPFVWTDERWDDLLTGRVRRGSAEESVP